MTQNATTAPAPAVSSRASLLDRRGELASALVGKWRIIPLLVSIAFVWMYFASRSDVFLTSRNLSNLASQIAVTATLALGAVFILLVRQIDLSLAAVAAASAGLAANLVVLQGWSLAGALVATLGAAMAVSAVQALLCNAFGAPAFIVTLGAYFILGAVLLWLIPQTQVISVVGSPLENVAGSYLSGGWAIGLSATIIAGFAVLRVVDHRERLANGLASAAVTQVIVPVVAAAALTFGVLQMIFLPYQGVPLPVALVAAFTICLSYIASNTAFGRHIYAVGGNPEAARRAGVSVAGVVVVVFMIGGLMAACAGVMSASRTLGVSSDSSDLTLLLDALAAVVIGGVSMFGGRGSVWAAVIGSLLIGSISNGLFLLSATTEVRWTITGVVLILAVLLDSAIVKKGAP